MVQEQRGEYPSLWAANESNAPKIGCVPQTLNEWVKRAEVDAGTREGVTTAEAQRVKELEREVNELRRANEILKLASAFFCPGGARPPTQVLKAFIDQQRNAFGVEPLCKVLQVAPSVYFHVGPIFGTNFIRLGRGYRVKHITRHQKSE